MTSEHPLLRLGGETAGAVAAALDRLGVPAAAAGQPAVHDDCADAFAGVPLPATAASVGFAGGLTATNVLLLPPDAARALAACAVEGEAQDERTAVAAVAGRVLSAAAEATGLLLGVGLQAGDPEARAVASPADLAALDQGAAQAVVCELTVLGETVRLVQLLPNASVVRVTGALDALAGDVGTHAAGTPAGPSAEALGGAVLATRLRVWAEVGRARLPAGRVVSLPAGSVVELDQLAEDPVDVFVNGHRYATGRLVVDEGGEWAVRVERILARPASDAG